MTDLAIIAALAIAFIVGVFVGGLLVARVVQRMDDRREPAIDTPDTWEGR